MDRILAIGASNFRSIANAELKLSERHSATFIVGEQGSGKSTALDLLDFAGALVRGGAGGFLAARAWNPDDLFCRSAGRKRRFIELRVRGIAGGREFVWTAQYDVSAGTCPVERLAYDGDAGYLLWSGGTMLVQGEHVPSGGRREGSILASLDGRGVLNGARQVKRLLAGLRHFGAVCPAAVKLSKPRVSDGIGPRGKDLAGFLAGLGKGKKLALADRTRCIFPRFDGFSVKRLGDGSHELYVLERDEGGHAQTVPVAGACDAAVRLLAVMASAMHFNGISLLEEVDAGLHPQTIAPLVRQLLEAGGQTVCTANSPDIMEGMPEDGAASCARIAFRQNGGTAFAVLEA